MPMNDNESVADAALVEAIAEIAKAARPEKYTPEGLRNVAEAANQLAEARAWLRNRSHA